ncbi:hypothetical protein [Parvibaculum sp.]|jgi:hypothetical protein|uniref:hypothetical protein n=1 Tax=Parvibaculum sp. TaxID=2024848 RepID=UPI002A2D2D9F|nr:hypothetical protein [Parvibaculum sp.]
MTTILACCRALARKARKSMLLLAAGAGLLALPGCAAPAIGALTVAEVLTIAGISSTIMTGRDLGEHALSVLTGKDCRFLEAALREGRSFCEDRGSEATKDDFGGIIALFEREDGTKAETAVAAADLNPMVLGFAPVDRHAAHEFSLEIARNEARNGSNKAISFGMMSATFGQSWAYDLDMKPDTGTGQQVAAAAPKQAPATSLGLRPAHSPYMGL